MVVYAVAYLVKPWVTDEVTRVYFLPALTVRIVGALAVGFIYQFYYQGGDTFNYHTHGSRHLWNAFMESPEQGMNLFFNERLEARGVYRFASKIIFFTDPGSYAIVRLAFIFDIFTFSTYSATAVLFAVFSFIGVWMFFLTFYQQYPHLHKSLALASFFIPSVFFWGSGLLKDTITLGCLGIVVYQTYLIFIVRRFSLHNIFILSMGLYGLYAIKVYIFLTFLPAAIVWIFLIYFDSIRSMVLKIMIFPLMIVIALGLGIYSIIKTGEGNKRYSMNKIGETAQITAYDIRYYTGKDAGSGYAIGELDGSLGSMISLAPQAINVTLFRPYLWEVTNPLMLLAALESLALLILVVYLIVRAKLNIFGALREPNVVFLLLFSIVFSFGVGVSTFNFGTLVRYKIPMLPFFVVALTIMLDYSKRRRKLAEFEITE